MQDELDDLLAEAAQRPMRPSEALMARVEADAIALQPTVRPLRVAARPGAFSRLANLFGGAPVLAGLGSAAVFGLALGYLSPTTLNYLTGSSSETAEFFPEADFLTTEG